MAKKPTVSLTKAALNRFIKSASAKTLRDEIALARFTLESMVNGAEDSSQLWRRAHEINQLILTIKDLVEANAKLERSIPIKK